MLKVVLINKWQHLNSVHAAGPLEFGRGDRRQAERVVIVNDAFVSRDQMRIEGLPNGRLRIENLSATNTVRLEDGTKVDRGAPLEIGLPVRITIGNTVVEIASGDVKSNQPDFHHTLFPSVEPEAVLGEDFKGLSTLGETPSAVVVAHWFETLLSVQKAAAGSNEFYQGTARAMVDLIGLDRGMVLLFRGGVWEIVANYVGPGCEDHGYSRTVLQQLQEQRRTLYQTPQAGACETSLVRLESVVAAPIFDSAGALLGAVYGSRDARTTNRSLGIQPLEAQVVQLLAAIINTGFIRLQHEVAVAEARARFEQFCSPELASELQRNPSLLNGTEREVTVLFTDLRGFSTLSERLASGPLYRMMGDLMDRLTNCVIGHGGIVVDYYGDGLCAMWDAPTDQADHADRACAAALDMHRELPALNASWAPLVGAPLEIGIGINTGTAQVGNMGGQRRLKYGPRGHTVNLASRVEGATKKLGVPTLLTDATRQRLHGSFALRRMCKVRLMGISGSDELYELYDQAADAVWEGRRIIYERALEAFESGHLEQSRALLDQLLVESSDGPSQVLRQRVLSKLADPSSALDAVFSLDSK
jgi:adenylate cyclase